jgi:hypothetical protein
VRGDLGVRGCDASLQFAEEGMRRGRTRESDKGGDTRFRMQFGGATLKDGVGGCSTIINPIINPIDPLLTVVVYA